MSRRRARQGNTALQVVMSLTALMGGMALTVDVGRLSVARQDAQNVADAAALAGVAYLQTCGMDEAGAKAAAVEAAQANKVMALNVTMNPGTDVQVGMWDDVNKTIIPFSPALQKDVVVKATVRFDSSSTNGAFPMTFAKIFGLQTVPIVTSGTAAVKLNAQDRKPVDVMVVQDGSGSFVNEWSNAINADKSLDTLINSVAKNDTTGFVAFNDQIMYTQTRTYSYGHWVYTNNPLTLDPTTLTGGSSLPAAVNDVYTRALSIDANGWTDPSVAFHYAIDELIARSSLDTRKSIVLVSDGMPFGPSDAYTRQYQNNTIAEANRAAAAGITVHTVTLTYDAHTIYGEQGADYDFNASLCRNGGYAFRTYDGTLLRDVLIQVGSIILGRGRLIQ